MHNHFNHQSAVLRAAMGSELIAVGEYAGLRELCHRLKASDSLAVREAAGIVTSSLVLPQESILIPMPSHLGYATYTLELAEAISSLTGVPVLDTLKGRHRMRVYDAKRLGLPVREEELGLYLSGGLPNGLKPIILDNVIATGTTARAALDVIPDASVLSLAIDSPVFMSR